MDLKGFSYYHRVKIKREHIDYMTVLFYGESKLLPKWESSVPM